MRFVLLIFSFICISLGITITINVSEVGIEPWAAAHVGLANYVFTVGIWTTAYQITLITLAMIIEKHRPRIGTFLSILFIGPFIDLFLYLDFIPHQDNILFMWLQFIIGIMVACFGAALSIYSNLGASPKTQFYVTISNVFKLQIFKSKMFFELIGLFVAFFVGGPIFIGTLFFVFITGPFVQWFLFLLNKIHPFWHSNGRPLT